VFLVALLIQNLPNKIFAQAIDSTNNDEQLLLETIASNTESEIKFDIEPTQLLYFKTHPINLNSATAEQLKELGLLTDIQINNIISYRKTNSDFASVYELQVLTTLDLIIIKRILPYIKIDGSIDDFQIPFSKIITTGRYQIISRLSSLFQTAEGYKPDELSILPSNKYYEGNKYRFYNRFNYSFGNKLSYGITTEKDAGEAFFKGSQKSGFDYYSAHFYLKTNSAFEAIAIGDYEIKIGQGLLMYTGFGYTKSAMVTSIKKEIYSVLSPYKSSNEFNYLRGAAFTFRLNKNNRITPFFSYRKLDGNVVSNDSTISTDDAVTTIVQGGYHRTQNEIADKNTQALQIIGATYLYKKNNLKLGISAIQASFGKAIQRQNQPYTLYNFQGKNWGASGFDYSYIYKNINFFGEASFNNFKQYATVNGLMASLDSKLDVAILYRKYTPGYYSLYSLGFSENSNNINEQGIYMGAIIKPFNQIQIAAYADFFKFPWLKFGVDAPSSGFDYFLQATYKPDKLTVLFIRYQLKQKQTNKVGVNLANLIYEKTHNIRFNASYSASPTVTLHNRLDVKIYDLQFEKQAVGFMILQDVSYNPAKKPFDFTGRISLFNVLNFNTRIYAFEQDVPGSFSVPMFYGKGFHSFIMVHYRMNKKIDAWVRVGETFYPDEQTIGSGLDLINSNHKTDFKLQIRFTL
jgi:hypothetical protein